MTVRLSVLALAASLTAAAAPDAGAPAVRVAGFEAPRFCRVNEPGMIGVDPWRPERRGFFVGAGPEAQGRLLGACCRLGAQSYGRVTCRVYLYEATPAGLALRGRGELGFPATLATSKSRERVHVAPKGLTGGTFARYTAHGGWLDYLRPGRDLAAERLYVWPEPLGDAAALGAHAGSFLAGNPWWGMREEHFLAMLGGSVEPLEVAPGTRGYRSKAVDATFEFRAGVLVGMTARGRRLAPDAPDAPQPAPSAAPSRTWQQEADELMGDER